VFTNTQVFYRVSFLSQMLHEDQNLVKVVEDKM
jgi:hypothetical protein